MNCSLSNKDKNWLQAIARQGLLVRIFKRKRNMIGRLGARRKKEL